MYTIVGLGNMGDAYHDTRHNVGWSAVEYFALLHELPDARTSTMIGAAITRGTVLGTEVLVVYPHTFMNNSGLAVKQAMPEPHNFGELIVVHDDIDLPCGEVRIGVGKGSGGHNGVQSVIDSLRSNEFIRVRIGIAGKTIFGNIKRPQGEALPRYVLGRLKFKERVAFEEAKKKVNAILETILKEGVAKAMNQFN